MKRYVVGFIFNEPRSAVVLIKKNKPKWQAGLLNGVGGKIEEGEVPVSAMVRETLEETGCLIRHGCWNKFAQITQTENNAPWVVHFFHTTGDYTVRSTTREPVAYYPVVTLQQFPTSVVPNLLWLIPLALERNVTGLMLQHNWPHPE